MPVDWAAATPPGTYWARPRGEVPWLRSVKGKGLVLYHNDMSTCAQKVRIVLAEKGVTTD
eukprot:gene54161-35365_t